MSTSTFGRARRRALSLATASALALAGLSFSVQPANATITPTVLASDLATAMTAVGTNVTGSSFVALPSGTPNGVGDNAPGLGGLPTEGSTYAILTTGEASLADDSNSAGDSGAPLGGAPVRGDSDLDVTILKVDVDVAVGQNCLRLDFRFLSEEYPEYVGDIYNDSFIAELDTSDWTTSGSTITAPNNFAFDPSSNPISINAAGNTSMSAPEATGTTYDGATPLLSAATPITPGAHSLYLSIFDQGDSFYDSAAFVDNLVVGFAATPAQCAPGAEPVNAAPVSSTSCTSVQYSDAVNFTAATATDAESDAITMTSSALPASLVGTDDGAGSFGVAGTATASPAGSPYSVTYTASDASESDSEVNSITINREDCTLTAPPTILSSALSNTTLTAALGELDASLGDLSGKSISFSGFDGASNPVGPFVGTTNASGNVSVSVPLTEGVYALTASFAGDDYYKDCATSGETIVTVTPAIFKVTGGGWITQGTGRTSFGFNAKTDVTGLHGQLQIRPANKSKFHGNVVLTLSGSGNNATWTGTGKWNGVAGYRFTAVVVDNGTSGKKGDTISLVVKNPAGTVTVWTTGGAQPLKGGNIVVH
jgi:hypothetical protein